MSYPRIGSVLGVEKCAPSSSQLVMESWRRDGRFSWRWIAATAVTWVGDLTRSVLPTCVIIFLLFTAISAATAQVLSADIGTVAAAGSDSGSGSTATVTGSGSDIWNTADGFHFRYTSWSGDGTFIARVTGITNTNGWAKAGIMLREDLTAASRNVYVCVNPVNGEELQMRSTAGGSSTAATGPYSWLPTWIKLVRSGNAFSGYFSEDGVSWTLLTSYNIPLGQSLFVGLAVTSHNDGALCTANFDNVNFLGSSSAPATPTGITAVADGGAITLGWTDNSNNETGFAIERSTDGNNFSVITTAPANATSYADNSVGGGGTYYYRVTAVAGSSSSAPSGVLRVTSGAKLQAPNFYPPQATDTSFVLQWGSQDGTTPFEVQQSLDGSTFTTVVASTSAYTFTVTGLSASTNYFYRVRAGAAPNHTPWSTVLNARTAPTPPSALSAAASDPGQISLAWTDNSNAETNYQVLRLTTTNNFDFDSRSVAFLPGNTTTFVDTGLTAGTTYYYKVRAVDGELLSPMSNFANATVSAGGTPPSATSSVDVGSVGANGSDNVSGGTVTVNGSGADIWDTSDAFHYRYQAWTGDGTFIARSVALDNTDGWAKAGIMLREDITASARHVFVGRNPSGTAALFVRSSTGGTTSYAQSVFDASPQWLKLTRSGNVFNAYQSTDGVNWTQIGSATTLTLPTTVVVGLAVTSHRTGTLATATFDNVSFSAGSAQPPSVPTAPTGLSATAASSSQINLNWTDNSNNETGFQIERSADNNYYASIQTVSSNTTTFADLGLNAATTYYYRVRATNSGTTSAYSNTASVATSANTPPSGGFTGTDIGAASPAGSDSSSGSVVTLRGAGADIWDTADGFHYRSQSWTGDGTFIARSVSLDNTDGWAKAGIMVREDLAAGSRHVFAGRNPSGTAALFARTTPGGTTSYQQSVYDAAPQWLKLTRSGNNFAAYQSTDGVTWTQIGTTLTLVLPATVNVGLAVTSHSNGTLATATFDNVSFTAGSAPPPPVAPAAPTGLSATATSSSQINLTWTDNATSETGFSIERSSDNVTFAQIGTAAVNATSYADTGLPGSTTFYYRVIAAGSGSNSSPSNVATATTGAATAPTLVGPTNFRVTHRGANGEVDFAWTDNSSDETGFVIERKAADYADSYASVATLSANVTTYIATVGEGKPFLYRVKAIRGSVSSSYSGEVGTEGTKTPTLNLSTVTSTSIAVRMSEAATTISSGNTFGPTSVERSTDATNYTVLVSGLSGPRSGFDYNDTTVAPSTTYYYRARFADTNGDVSAYSSVVTFTTSAAPTPPAAPSNLQGTTPTSHEIDLTWVDNANNETGFQVERSTDNVTFTLVTTTGAQTQGYADTTVAAGTTYYYRVRAVNATGSSAYTSTVTVATAASWAQADIGNVGVAGSFDFTAGTLSISASGDDIWGSADAFHFVYQPWHGDGQIIGRVTAVGASAPLAKAGVMFRETLNAGAKNAFVYIPNSNNVGFQSRTATSGATTVTTGGWIGAPYWVRLVRTGNTFSAYVGPDGTNWTLIGTQTVTMGVDIYVGFAETAHNNATTNSATFTSPIVE